MTVPTGTVTFLFTDIEGSTRLWDTYPVAMRIALALHDEILRESIERHSGYVFKTVGDAFCAAFPTAPEALGAALDAHLALQEQEWGDTGQLMVRIGLHTGVAEERGGDYFGPTLNRTARLQGIAHGQQTLLSHSTYELVRSSLPESASLADLGLHRLKDLSDPEHVWQLLHPSLPREYAPLKSLDYLPNNLPRQLTSFIGREKEMDEVTVLLEKSSLLTLTGSGGCGKTRLALQIAANVLEEYSDGVWLVELAALTEPSLVALTTAACLNVREETGRAPLETLADVLREKSLLIVLDNCEHLIEATARLAESLLRACPGVRILATSREPLQIQGEVTYRVPSLEVPDPKRRTSAREQIECGAVRLFCNRAAAAQFEITPDTTDAVVQICLSVDGIPLAIELAAARVRTLPVEEIARRLNDRFSLLKHGSRTALPRHQTLRALIDWSWDLLTPQERIVLRRISVFSGGLTIEAAERVCAGESESWRVGEGETTQAQFLRPTTYELRPDEVLDLLTQLVDKSLVIMEDRPSAPRFRLMETIREYALDRLGEAGEESEFRRRHFDWSQELAKEAQPNFDGPRMQEWLDRLELEHGNLRAALSNAPTSEDRLRLAIQINRFWQVRGFLAEGREWMESALRDGSGGDVSLRAKGLNCVGVLAWRQGDLEAARSAISASLELHLRMDNRTNAAAALNNLGLVATDHGDLDAARAYFEDAANIYRELGDRALIGKVLANLGANLIDQDDLEPAAAACEEFLEIAQENKDPWCTAAAWHNLAEIARRQGDFDRARTLGRKALTLTDELGDDTQVYRLVMLLGEIALDEGSPELAAELFAAMEAFRTALGLHFRDEEAESLDRATGTARSLLSTDVFTACWKKGSELSREEAIRYGLTGEAGKR